MEIIFSKNIIVYIAVVLAVILTVAYFLRKSLVFIEKGRKKHLKNQPNIDSIPARLNKTLDRSKTKKKRLLSLKTRFTITRRTIYLFLLLIALLISMIPIFNNISPAMISIAVACISVVVGIAAKPFIENMICGLALCFGKLAKIGDTVVVDGEYGVIEDVTLTHCIIKRWDWLRYVVPNSSMMTKEFLNYSLNDNYRWVYVEFWVDYKSDIASIEKIAKDSPANSKYFNSDEDTRFWIIDMEKEAVKCMVVAWATSPADGWMLSIDIRKKLMEEFQKQGITIHTYNLKNINQQTEVLK